MILSAAARLFVDGLSNAVLQPIADRLTIVTASEGIVVLPVHWRAITATRDTAYAFGILVSSLFKEPAHVFGRHLIDLFGERRYQSFVALRAGTA